MTSSLDQQASAPRDGACPPIILFSTTDGRGDRIAMLQRMVASVARFREATGASVRLLLLRQCAEDGSIDLPSWVEVSEVTGHLPLSVARNRLIESVTVPADAVVAFPDDDAWYPDGALEHIVARFRTQPTLDFWFCRYANAPVAVDAACERKPVLQDVLREASSNTIVVRGRLLNAIGGFDPELGVGAPLGSAEDTDFAIRAFGSARASCMLDAAVIGHRDRNSAMRARYYRGALITIIRHARTVPGGRKAALRKVAVGMALTVTRPMSVKDFRRAMREGAAAWRHAPHTRPAA